MVAYELEISNLLAKKSGSTCHCLSRMGVEANGGVSV